MSSGRRFATVDRHPEPAASTKCTAFDGHRRLAAGLLRDVAVAVKRAAAGGSAGPLLVFDDVTGCVIDVDTRGTDQDVVDRLPAEVDSMQTTSTADASRGRGRPKLGVVAREVTLLPRHWAWLAEQPGGASVALRKLVEEARRAGAAHEPARQARDAAYRFMHAIGGDFAGFEEASRALFAGDRVRFEAAVQTWPTDVRDHAVAMSRAGGGAS
ncbi:MAG TPA: DUF2239 family protein [Gemmatimonadaceae bacterium]